MKRNIKVLLILMILLIAMAIPHKTFVEEGKNSLTILFTHDLHDHYYPFQVEEKGQIKTLGGYARLYSVIKSEREKDPNLLLIDGGDFSMGTLFQTIFSTDSPALRIMGKMGYDVTTFGNHEFDFRAEGLAESLMAAKNSRDPLPEIVASNIFFPEDDNELLSPELEKLKKSMVEYGVKDYVIIERKGFKIGIFGLMGKEADSNAPMAGVEFTDQIKAAKNMVNILKDEENVDLIICLSHSGTSSDKSKSEDEILAKEIPDIDVIISAHTHTTLHEPIIVGNTIIASCGQYGENLGIINISPGQDNKWHLKDYRLEPITDSIPMDETISEEIEYYKSIVQDKYLDRFNLTFDEVLAYSPFSFTPLGKLGSEHGEDILGNLISDSYIYAVKKAEGENYEPIAVAIVPNGTIRGSFVKGYITVDHVFTVSSLGIGADKVSGYPLISVYLTGKELKTVAEVDASIAPIMSVAQLYTSGLNYTFNPNRLIFNKVTDVYLEREDGSREEIEDDKLYRVVAGLYSAQMLSIVGDKSFGLLSIVPKTKDGVPIEDFEAHIIYDSGHEIKEWLALAEYLKSFDKENGIPQVPEYYSQKQGRKIVDDDPSIIARIKNPNRIALILYSIILIILTLIALLIRIIIRRRKKKTFA
ncbi:bifunctional metallophosphatase/5'-nucleotidase [Tepidimicrobium xylanilyticum]|uniref:2',3'-cyclic-nucleotide 2'-phosphodiesterase/5'-or 3'-nucleotidase, 5'-nucleotidase family n=1 Tax=Tepidimicrobium xylanilyticum TaxID=1123352 RepID=A0A1H2Z7D8_9FIRM|nr:bifunctional UDP-sugar hydrolase/5'-nucleotidase [Tepidimicrobium xylanilyticum]SDX13235.1 2',3'-cyclic-nucleotide 2'-phosphodiesterase/5'-or 3'-nucleotidase, 5'-nucleotidase family [Tepidimicrobium xylanilyticum]